jgi:hypothetical protein
MYACVYACMHARMQAVYVLVRDGRHRQLASGNSDPLGIFWNFDAVYVYVCVCVYTRFRLLEV